MRFGRRWLSTPHPSWGRAFKVFEGGPARDVAGAHRHYDAGLQPLLGRSQAISVVKLAVQERTNNLISRNRILNIGSTVGLSDLGGIYTLGISPGTVIDHNWISDVNSFNYGSWGIYLDQASTDIRVSNNLVYDTGGALFHQHWGVRNVVENNCWAYGGRTINGAGIRTDSANNTNEFYWKRNILYFDPPAGNHLPVALGTIAEYKNVSFADNLYYSPNGAPMIFPGNVTFSEWQKSGRDARSIVANPMFRNAKARDFELSPDSPAIRKLGFVPIDLSIIGPQ